MTDLPDYTKYIAAAPTPTPVGTLLGTKAESVTHKIIEGSDTYALTVELAAPPTGQKIGLILIIVSTSVAGSEWFIETLQNASWTQVLGDQYLARWAPGVILFPCWIPEQDVGDGSTVTVRIVMSGSCSAVLSAFILYFFE